MATAWAQSFVSTLPQPNAVTFYGIAQRGTTVQDAYVPGVRVNADNPDFSQLSTTPWFKTADRDLAFELGFGAAPTSVAPEPGTWALLGTGLLLVGAGAARRRRTA